MSRAIAFFGDSITDCRRDRENPHSLGEGYVSLIAEKLREDGAAPLDIFNRGLAGNRIYDLEARVETDIVSLKSGLVSILAGVNDTWRVFDRQLASPIDQFQASYRRIVERLLAAGSKVIVVEPFFLPIPEDRRAWRADLDARIACIRQLASDYHLPYLPLDGLFAAESMATGFAHFLPDGVHPSPAGHALIAEAWLRRFSPIL